jgi:hypothetical protein
MIKNAKWHLNEQKKDEYVVKFQKLQFDWVFLYHI